MEKNLKNEEIKNRVVAIYENLQRKYEEEGLKNKVDKVNYYETLQINSPAGGLELYGTYTVRVINEHEKALYEIYDNNMQLATIDENGRILFSEEYKQDLIDRKELLWTQQLAQIEMTGARLEVPEKLKEEDIEFKEQDIIEEKNKQKENTQLKEQEHEKELSEDEQEEAIAQEMGLSKSEIACKAKIDPKQMVTSGEIENETFEDIIGVKNKYKTIYVINANKNTEGNNKRFAFVGITKEGKVEHIDLPTRGSTIPDRRVYTINRDGSSVKEELVTEMFRINRNKAISVRIGQFGKMEVSYLRRSPGEDKFIGSPIETERQRRTREQVREAMSETNTTKWDLNDTVKNTKEQIGEQGSDKTNLNNIDDKQDNDIALDKNEKITMHDGTTTTLAEEAENLSMNIDEYNNYFEKAEGDCAADKIENIRQEVLDKDEEPTGREDRGGRLTPEEEALLRMQNNNN